LKGDDTLDTLAIVMRFLLLFILGTIVLAMGFGIFHVTYSSTDEEIALSTHGTFVENTASIADTLINPYANWQRPAGPPKVALQVGHWKNKELPDEFERLRETGGGTSGGGKAEWEVNLAIAELTAEVLRKHGVTVEILPATVPPEYWADVLVSIHADGNENSGVSGYKVAAPRRDITGTAEELASFLEEEYGKIVGFALDPNVTRNMRGYYAFNWRRYEHAMHPMTTAAIIETGFLTSPQDRKILINQPERSAQGIAQGILAYLRAQKLTQT
jgi:hypothetical protein